ncbi:MAG: F0F1 ATP synthase subunit delta [Propionibacteriaceae bacterium]
MRSERSARIAQLDGVLDELEVGPELAGELFAVVDLVDHQPALKRALTDPGSSDDRRRGLVRSVFDGQVSEAAVQVLAEAAALRWMGGRLLADAIEREGVRALLRSAEAEGRLDDVEDELFRFSRTVAGDPDLRGAISDRSADLGRRRSLVAGLLDGRAAPETSALAQRAVAARERSFAVTLESFVALAAQIRDRVVATVRVARPLDAEQTERLRRALRTQVGRELALQVVVESELLGGVRVELGDEVIDGSVAAKLAGADRLFG